MPQSKHEIQSFLSEANMQPRHRFGQNFMIDQNLVRIVTDAGSIAPGDVVIEIGPGTGTLTDEILSRGAEVIAVEIDRDLAKQLRHRFAIAPRFRLIEGDALSSKHALNDDLSVEIAATQRAARPLKLVANLPYNIASPLVIELLLAGVDVLAFTVQKEVADRLRANAGDDAYGPLSVVAQTLSGVEVLRTLPPQAFWPAPKVESALVRLTRDNQLGPDAPEFGRFVQKLFSFRRKTLRKALLESGLDAEAAIKVTGFEPQLRPEVLTGAQLRSLFEATRAPKAG